MSTLKPQNRHAQRLRQIAVWEGGGPLSLILTDAADELDRLAAELFSYKQMATLPETRKDQP